MIVKVIVLQVLAVTLCQTVDFLNTGIHSQSGLHYEVAGRVRFTTAEWRLAAYIDLRKFISQRPFVTRKMLENMNQTCKYHAEDEKCVTVLQAENLLMKEENVEKYINQFLFFMNESMSDKKYVPSGFLGIISETFFHSLNETQHDYGRIMNKTVDNSRPHIIQTGLHHLHDELDEMKNRTAASLTALHDAIKLIEDLAKNGTFYGQPYHTMMNRMRDWSDHLTMELDNYQYTLQTIIDAVYLAKAGVIHPELFTYEILENAVNHFITTNQDRSLVFPLSSEQLHSEKLMKISKTNVGFEEGKLIVVLDIPLLKSAVYYLYKMYPYPTAQVFGHRQGSAYIQPRGDYLLLSQYHYTLARSEDIAGCLSVDNHQYICKLKYPFYDATYQPICEAAMFMTGRKLSPLANCSIKLSSTFASYWKQTEKSWLYSVPEREVNFSCGGEWRDAMNISGTGILQVKTGCEAYTSYATMIGYQQFVEISAEYITARNLNVTQMVQKYVELLPQYYVQLDEFLYECKKDEQSSVTILFFAAAAVGMFFLWLIALLLLLFRVTKEDETGSIVVGWIKETHV